MALFDVIIRKPNQKGAKNTLAFVVGNAIKQAMRLDKLVYKVYKTFAKEKDALLK